MYRKLSVALSIDHADWRHQLLLFLHEPILKLPRVYLVQLAEDLGIEIYLNKRDLEHSIHEVFVTHSQGNNVQATGYKFKLTVV